MTQERIATSVAQSGSDVPERVVEQLRQLLADTFALYVKTKAFHWHMTGRHFRDHHLLLDEQATQVFEMIDAVAERARKLGGTTLRSVGDISRNQRLQDDERQHIFALDMLQELLKDNRRFVDFLKATHATCEAHGDIATASLIEVWVDETERRAWFLSAISSEAAREKAN